MYAYIFALTIEGASCGRAALCKGSTQTAELEKLVISWIMLSAEILIRAEYWARSLAMALNYSRAYKALRSGVW